MAKFINRLEDHSGKTLSIWRRYFPDRYRSVGRCQSACTAGHQLYVMIAAEKHGNQINLDYVMHKVNELYIFHITVKYRQRVLGNLISCKNINNVLWRMHDAG